MTTFLPSCAKVTAKLTDVVVLPAPGSGDVTRILRTGLSIDEIWIFVLSILYDSDMGDLGLS